jgi:ribonuclease-3
MSEEQLDSLQKLLAYSFRDLALLKEAITHKSYLNEFKEPLSRDNERLEFLGDAVLDLVISEYLIQRYPELQEGDLSKRKAKIVSEPFLARIAQRLELGDYLRLGRGEELTRGREKSSLLANTLEAVIAAIYLDGGLEKVRPFILSSFEEDLEQSVFSEAAADYKTELQELSQKIYEVLPVYEMVSESGPDHRKTFEVVLLINGAQYGFGSGRSKKEAEQQAAKQALERLKQE